MTRIVTQLLVGLMLLFGVLTLFPKAYLEFRANRSGQTIKYILLGLLALFFSAMSFLYAYLGWQQMR
jgi:hypothetical protein